MTKSIRLSVQRVERIIQAMGKSDGSDVSGALRDLMTEMRHYCDAKGVDFHERPDSIWRNGPARPKQPRGNDAAGRSNNGPTRAPNAENAAALWSSRPRSPRPVRPSIPKRRYVRTGLRSVARLRT